MVRTASACSFLLLVHLLGCSDPIGDQPDGGRPDGARLDGLLDGARETSSDAKAPEGDGAAAGGTISIYVKGDLTDPSFQDGLSGQTPTDYEIALSRYHVLTSAADPSPVLCFDHGKTPFVARMNQDNRVGSCQTSSVPTATYTHGRTKVDWARYTVEGVYHYLGQKLAGKFTFFRAYSDVTVGGRTYKAGDGTITYSGVTTVELPVVYPPPPSVPPVTLETVGGELLMTFPYSKPLPISQPDAEQHWARFNWKIKDSFRWVDAALPGYQAGVWDVAPTGPELVMLYGVSGYYTTSSLD